MSSTVQNCPFSREIGEVRNRKKNFDVPELQLLFKTAINMVYNFGGERVSAEGRHIPRMAHTNTYTVTNSKDGTKIILTTNRIQTCWLGPELAQGP